MDGWMDGFSGGPLQHARRELLESILEVELFSQLFLAFQAFLACEAG